MQDAPFFREGKICLWFSLQGLAVLGRLSHCKVALQLLYLVLVFPEQRILQAACQHVDACVLSNLGFIVHESYVPLGPH